MSAERGGLSARLSFAPCTSAPTKEGSVTTSADARITPIGRLFRNYKLDESPQLWNVLVGKMSFVGPRPDVPGYADKLEGEARQVLELRPGITGPATLYFRYEEDLLAQVSDPKQFNDTVIWPKKIRLNLEYLENWSFWKDVGYILITVVPSLNRTLKLVPESPRKAEEVEAPVELRKALKGEGLPLAPKRRKQPRRFSAALSVSTAGRS